MGAGPARYQGARPSSNFSSAFRDGQHVRFTRGNGRHDSPIGTQPLMRTHACHTPQGRRKPGVPCLQASGFRTLGYNSTVEGGRGGGGWKGC